MEASTLLQQDAKNHQHTANRMANDSVQIHKNLVNIGELKVQKHLNKTAYTERSRAADNTVKVHIEEIIKTIQFLSTL